MVSGLNLAAIFPIKVSLVGFAVQVTDNLNLSRKNVGRALRKPTVLFMSIWSHVYCGIRDNNMIDEETELGWTDHQPIVELNRAVM